MVRLAEVLRRGMAVVLLVGVVSCGGAGGGGGKSGDGPDGQRESADSETADAESAGIRQTDARGRRLPFETEHSDRWNRRNDGTTYEPCTALSSDGLRDLGVEPSSVRDAAGTNGQTLRGCQWEYQDSKPDDSWFVSQIVGNAESLATEKRTKSSDSYVWRDDVLVSGRVVGVLARPTWDNCSTYVQSDRAAVNTIVFDYGTSPLDMDEACDRALEFTRATIDQMPE